MEVIGWNNGSPNNKTGAGYGLRIQYKDRDKYFKTSWQSVFIEFDNGDIVEVKLSDSFWRSCSELRSKKIGKWMIDNGLAPWPPRNPPHLELEPTGERKFRLRRN